jgi:hypothetical protein
MELKEGRKPDKEKMIDALKNRFQSVLFIRVDEIELLPFGSLKTSEHKGKTMVDMRKAELSSPP